MAILLILSIGSLHSIKIQWNEASENLWWGSLFKKETYDA